MAGHDIVVIGGSAGGLKPLSRICAGLPRNFPAAVFVAMHVSRNTPSALPNALERAGPLPVRHAVDGAGIKRGTIAVAPPDQHLLLRPGHMVLRRGAAENFARPAIDPLFRSAAVAYRSRVIAVVLSGLRDDGSAGLIAVKSCGGLCVVQDPDDADWAEMPRNALRRDHVDHVTAASEIPRLLCRLVQQPPGGMLPIPRNLILETRIAMQESSSPDATPPIGRPTELTCPQCGGVLNEVPEKESLRFRCQIGHAFGAEGLLAVQDDLLEQALDSALRIHRERLILFRRMQRTAERSGHPTGAAHWRQRADESERAADVLTQALAAMGRTKQAAD